MRAQSARLIAAIPDRGYTVVPDERGQTFDSLKFAKWVERLTIDSPHGVNFVVGSDVGGAVGADGVGADGRRLPRQPRKATDPRP